MDRETHPNAKGPAWSRKRTAVGVGGHCRRCSLRLARCDLTMAEPITNVAGFDDAPFPHEHRGQVRIVGAVCARTRLDGVVSGFVRRDGSNATRRIEELVRGTRFADNVRAVLLQGIAVAGFNVIDIVLLHESLRVPVIVVMRRPPRLDALKQRPIEAQLKGPRLPARSSSSSC